MAAEQAHERVAALVESNEVLLFMKGNRESPQCGFSATVVRILDTLIPHYATFDVLSDPGIREGVKTYSSWPTIPQLYVKGEFIGGCDIIQDMFRTRELHQTLGVEVGDVAAPAITITDAAAQALRQAAERMQAEGELHIDVDARFQSALFFGPSADGEISIEANGVTLFMSPETAARANGSTIDVVETPQGPGFRIDNPNTAPPPGAVKEMTVQDLDRLFSSREHFELFDVRTPEERAVASIPNAILLTQEEGDRISALPRETRLIFHCHHGGRSQKAAEHFAALGFTNVFNLVGGIDAWSQEIDPEVPRY